MPLSMEGWRTLGRVGYLGARRDATFAAWDAEHGSGCWRMAWEVEGLSYEFAEAAMLYEDAYVEHMAGHRELVERLVSEASEVYDDQPSNIGCGLDYLRQETDRTHVQDIAIRRCLVRLGLWFQGREPIQIRDKLAPHPLSMALSPGQVPFHRPEWIRQPELEGWWLAGSVEAFYQSNRVLQVRS